jgi:plastocyanin
MLAFATLFSLAGLAAALNHEVQVGPGGALIYQPPSIVAAVGDTVSFVFTNKNLCVLMSPRMSVC